MQLQAPQDIYTHLPSIQNSEASPRFLTRKLEFSEVNQITEKEGRISFIPTLLLFRSRSHFRILLYPLSKTPIIKAESYPVVSLL